MGVVAARTSGWTRSPGCVPAEIATAFLASAIELKKELLLFAPLRLSGIYIFARLADQFVDERLKQCVRPVMQPERVAVAARGFNILYDRSRTSFDRRVGASCRFESIF